MGEIKWSKEQLSIINDRGNNLLVSAAAGAGKTTVMVERVLGLITDSRDNIDIDKLLIVTFTRDAAANMRDKLSSRLEEMLDKDPGNKKLMRQQILLQNAQITTIDSFCNSVVKEFFYRIDIDPSFRIADEAEITLLRNRVLDELLEEKYSGDDGDFITLVESFCGTKNDEKIGELVTALSRAAYAQAWPADWLTCLEKDVREDIDAETLRDEWKKKITDIVLRLNMKAVEASKDAVSVAASEINRLTAEGIIKQNDAKAQKLMSILQNENSTLNSIASAKDYESAGKAVTGATFDRMTVPKDFAEDAAEIIKKNRKSYKDVIGKIKDKWYSQTEKEYAGRCSLAAKPLAALISLTKEYLSRLLEQKKEKSLFEFSDISHFALEILAQKNEDGSYSATEAALELRERFHDIFIDEYQDSDSVQEQIAGIIAGAPGKSPYTFMVGDVKQSIYKFRMAKPELFIDRAHRYEQDKTEGLLIHLGLNYRSGRGVIDSVNDVFRLCMHENVGKVEYDKSAELVCGKEGKQQEGRGAVNTLDDVDITEIIIADRERTAACINTPEGTADSPDGDQTEIPFDVEITGNSPENGNYEGEEDTDNGGDAGPENGGNTASGSGFDPEEYSMSQLCAKAAALRINELFDNRYQVENKDGTLRDLRYGDIVILLRSVGTSAEVYREELEKAGIPVFSDSGQGFLGSYEISVVVNFLRLLDNPYQDIPLVSVLNSVMGGMDEEDLAKIRVFGGFNIPFWQCIRKYSKEGTEKAVKDKCNGFLSVYSDIRKINMTRDIDKIISAIYEKTGFYLYCMALPSGQSRVSNLDQLLTYAAKFEKNNSNGLFDFVGYLEEITKARDDLDEAVCAEGFDAVRIMTIHKSKGLEYPVVIIGDAARQFNMQDRNREVIISPDYGIAAKCIDISIRVKQNTVRRTLMAEQIELDTIGEELRLLYVAMTRAMKKLIVIGKPGKKGKTPDDWQKAADITKGSGRFPDHYIASAGGYMDLLYPAALLWPDHFLIRNILIKKDTGDEREARNVATKAAFAAIPERFDEKKADAGIMKELNYSYKSDPGSLLPVKLSVSDLKFTGDEEPEEKECLFSERKTAGHDGQYKYSIKKKNSSISGSELGTLYHKIMQFIPLNLEGPEDVRRFLDSVSGKDKADGGFTDTAPGRDKAVGGLIDFVSGKDKTGGAACENDDSCAIITAEEREAVDDEKIAAFIRTDLYRRMRRADAAGLLSREQPFMFGLKAEEADPVRFRGRSEMILVQGIIDCMFEEDGRIVILDYKTDALDENGEEELAGLYKKQLELYARAASQIMGKQAGEKILYSFALDKCITLKD